MQEVGRNDRCPCGSGKKYKKCCMQKKRRDQWVYIGPPERFDGFSMDEGQVRVHLPSGGEGEALVFSQMDYQGASGKTKVVYTVDGQAVFDPWTFFAMFNAVFVVDTNTKEVGGETVSVSSILECYAKAKRERGEIEIAYREHGNMFFRNPPSDEPERYAWARLAAVLLSSPTYSSDLRIAFVTDHDLSRLNEYNAGRSPIYDDLYLPTGFSLHYASSDKGSDSPLNRFMAICDRQASELLRELEKTGKATLADRVLSLDDVAVPPPTSTDPLFSRLKNVGAF